MPWQHCRDDNHAQQHHAVRVACVGVGGGGGGDGQCVQGQHGCSEHRRGPKEEGRAQDGTGTGGARCSAGVKLQIVERIVLPCAQAKNLKTDDSHLQSSYFGMEPSRESLCAQVQGGCSCASPPTATVAFRTIVGQRSQPRVLLCPSLTGRY